MTNQNKARLLDKFLKEYPFDYEEEYNKIFNSRKYMRDDDFEDVGLLFDKHQDYIIDFFTSSI